MPKRFNNLNAENKLFLLCTGTQLVDENKISFKEALKTISQWQIVLDFSVKNGTAPLLYKTIKENHFADCVPENIFKALKINYIQTASVNTKAFEAFKIVLEAFNEKGIKTVLLKGMASAEFIMHDNGLRPMGDIDIIVPPESLLDAENILFSLGYTNDKPYKSHKLRTLNIHNHLNAFKKDYVKIELHWDLSSVHHIYRLPTGSLWQYLDEVDFLGSTAYILKHEANIQYLSLHTISHFRKKRIRLNSFIDIAALINQHKDINWDQIIENTLLWHIERPVYSMLRILYQYFNCPIPTYVLNSIESPEMITNTDFELFLNEENELISFKTPSNYIKKITHIKGFGNKIRYMWAELFPSKAYIKHEYKLRKNTDVYFFYFVQFLRQTKKTLKNIGFLILRMFGNK